MRSRIQPRSWLQAKEKGNPQVKKIVDRVWERFASTSEHRALGVQDLYCAILLVYNDINKTLPGPFNDPPTKEEVQELLKTYDKNNDGMLDRNEFNAFIETFTKNVSARVSTNILLFSFVIPTIVTLARPGAEQLPLLGPAVKRAPTPVYSAIMTMLIVFAGSQFRKM
ncbi:uncharacterized protein [Physcomitrium patens]|uniref:uncharacterized protein isoform X1 n=1 Tax=Physcomitrium patens TaxID=3218 RepID=UPI000D159796|nr:uncharacterized protein LOC112279457 isoform X1 [Physcomitrium patens]|eukprot:XP_024369682.1 uncharacterized protein LOC112279457 isoform X1 [Physcomitrella patens]